MHRVAETLTVALISCTSIVPLHAQITTPTPATPAPSMSAPVAPLPQPRLFSPTLSGQDVPTRLFANSRYYVQEYQNVQTFGRCAVNIRARPVASLLEAAPNTATERFQLRFAGVQFKACLPYGYRAPVIFLRGALAEEMYRRQPIAFAVPNLPSPIASETAFQSVERQRSKARLLDDLRFSTLSNCVVVRAPLQVRQLLFSKSGSPEERVALQGALSAAPGCAVRTHLERDGATTFLRAYLAESAYRWPRFNAAEHMPIG